MSPMDEYARQRAKHLMDSGEYERGAKGHELRKGRHLLCLCNVNVGTSRNNDLLVKFTVMATEPDEDGIERYSAVTFVVDPSHDWLMEKWGSFCRGFGLDPTQIDLTEIDKVFEDHLYKEFKGDVDVSEKEGRVYVNVQPVSFTGNEVQPKTPF